MNGWSGALAPDMRANPDYQLHHWESLPADYRRRVERTVDRATIFGVLVGRSGTRLRDKLVDRAAAELFAALREPTRVPATASDRLAELVLDDVLQVRLADGFLSGPLAYEARGDIPALPPPVDRLGRLSRAALDHAERLRLPHVDALTARLYRYHRVPLSGRWTRTYPDRAAVLDALGAARPTAGWDGPIEPATLPGWLCWARQEGRAVGRAGFPYKLYVSPHVADLPVVLPATVGALATSAASRFKIAASAAGLLRPDKIVVHLRNAAELAAVAVHLTAALAGIRPHGVPFTAELAGAGLLSWGGDPPAADAPAGDGSESWRYSVCRRLAEHLVAAQAAPLRRVRPAEYALVRLAADGVDVACFAPSTLLIPVGTR